VLTSDKCTCQTDEASSDTLHGDKASKVGILIKYIIYEGPNLQSYNPKWQNETSSRKPIWIVQVVVGDNSVYNKRSPFVRSPQLLSELGDF